MTQFDGAFQKRFQELVRGGALVSKARFQSMRECGILREKRPMSRVMPELLRNAEEKLAAMDYDRPRLLKIVESVRPLMQIDPERYGTPLPLRRRDD